MEEYNTIDNYFIEKGEGKSYETYKQFPKYFGFDYGQEHYIISSTSKMRLDDTKFFWFPDKAYKLIVGWSDSKFLEGRENELLVKEVSDYGILKKIGVQISIRVIQSKLNTPD